MNLEDVMLNEVNQTKGTNATWFHVSERSKGEIHRDRKENGGYKGLVGVEQELMINGG
jgi:hypothetical protein